MIKATNDAGEEFDAYTADELAEQKAEVETAKAEAIAAKAEVERLNTHINMQKDNFKKLNELSEEERNKLSAEQIETRKRVEAAEARAQALEDKINEGENTRMKTDKEKALAKFHGGNKELKEALEKNYDLINLVGSSSEIIEERARLAANMEIGKMGNANPLYGNFNGSAPQTQKKNDSEKFFGSDKGKAASAMMGYDKPADKK
jgi:septal ring factor EnvC (AmiA/AmiB activator)